MIPVTTDNRQEGIMGQTQYEKRLKSILAQVALAMVLVCGWLGSVQAAPSANLWPRWQKNAEQSRQSIDHSRWATILDKYLVTGNPSEINRFRYATVSSADRQVLQDYIAALQRVTVTGLNRQEQKAYWINLYNALTVEVILGHYPVKSIMDIDISPGFFSQGPWDAKLLTIEGESISLNDIEHRILRPIFQDNRVHYALNCASLGCPNLQPDPFTAANMEEMLNKGAREYINHPRGVTVGKKSIQVSSIYKWFKSDFGGSDSGIIDHLLLYARDELVTTLGNGKKRLRFDYNWNLNE